MQTLETPIKLARGMRTAKGSTPVNPNSMTIFEQNSALSRTKPPIRLSFPQVKTILTLTYGNVESCMYKISSCIFLEASS